MKIDYFDAIAALRQENIRLHAELEAERQRYSQLMTLMLRGEAIREQMMLHAILNGAYNHLVARS